MGLGSSAASSSNSTVEAMQREPAPPNAWPELVAYDGRMAARAIQHDRPDVRVIVVRADKLSDQHERELNAQYALAEAWEEQAKPLTEHESRTAELVVLLCVGQCQGARAQDTVVTEPPFVMRRSLSGVTLVGGDGAIVDDSNAA